MVWVFERQEETLSCETRRTAAGYELVINFPDGSSDVRVLESPTAFLEGLAVVPQELMQQNWRPRVGTVRYAA